MTELVAVKESAWTKDDGTAITSYWCTLDGYVKDVPCYDVKVTLLPIGEPLPEGWEVKQSKAGKDYLAPPKAQGGGGKRDYVPRFGDTEPGFAALQERMDRRTALMQAVQVTSYLPYDDRVRVSDKGHMKDVLGFADEFFEWLRATSDSGVTSPPRAAGAGDSKPASPPESGTTSAGEAGGVVTYTSTSADASVPAPDLPRAGAAESGSGAVGGEAAASDPGLHPHEPQWVDSPTVRNMQMCAVAHCSLHPSRRKTAEVPA